MGKRQRKRKSPSTKLPASIIVKPGVDLPTVHIAMMVDSRNGRRNILARLKGTPWIWAKYKYQQSKSIVPGTLRNG